MSSLTFEATGPPAAPVVLLLHGFMGSRRDWAEVVEVLAPTHRCIAVDLPGHGETGDPGDEALWTPEGCVDALAGILTAAGGANIPGGSHHAGRSNGPGAAHRAHAASGAGGACIVGYSLGGRLALQLAIDHPARIARAVIVSGSPGIAEESIRRARREEDERRARRLETRGLEAFLDDWYRQPLFQALREHPHFPEVFERRRRNDPQQLARALRSLGTGSQRSLWGNLPGFRVPLLFLAGERDPKFTSLARDAVALCPRAEAVVLRRRGHALIEEDPEAVAGEMARFFGDDR